MEWCLINVMAIRTTINQVVVSFSSCTEFYFCTGYYELCYIETWIILSHL